MQSSDAVGQVKKEMREKYDPIGRAILGSIESGSLQDAETFVLGQTQPGQYWMEHKIGTAFGLGRFSKTDRLLEIGCTAGHYTMMLARQGYSVVGLDISADSVRAAQALARSLGLTQIDFIAADAEDMQGVPDNSFDGVFSFSTLRYVPNPIRSLCEIWRVLRPGGKAVVDFPNVYCPWFEFLKFLVGGERHPHDHTYSPKRVRRMMDEAGFVNIEVKLIIFFAKQFPSSLTPLYKAVDWLFERTPGVRHFAGIIMCKGEKAAP